MQRVHPDTSARPNVSREEWGEQQLKWQSNECRKILPDNNSVNKLTSFPKKISLCGRYSAI